MADNRKLSALPAAGTLGGGDLIYVVREGASSRTSLDEVVSFAAGAMQPAADNLTALSGLEALAGRLPYFTGVGAMATTPTTAFGREWLDLADADAGRGALAAASQGDVEALATTTTDALALKADNAAVEAATDALQASLDDLASGQAAGTVAAESWTVLAAYPTDDRADGDYARVIGADAGTHTDPVAGGTVANRGAYRWSASPAGWRRVGNLDSDDAAGFADTALAAAAGAVSGLPKVMAAMGGSLSGMFTTQQGDEALDDQTFPPGLFGQMHPDAFGADGILTEICVNVSASGTGRFFIRDRETQVVIWTADVALIAGVNTFIGGADYPLRKVTRGETFGFYATSGGRIKTGIASAGSQKYFTFTAAPEVGDLVHNGLLVAWTAPFALSYTLISTQDPAEEPTETRSRVLAVSQRFAGVSTPTDWVLGSAFSVSDGLVSTGIGGWGTYAYQTVYSALTQREIAARLNFADAESKYAIAVKPNPAGGAQFYGGALIIDGSTSKLGLYTWIGSGTAGVLVAEVDAPELSTSAPYVLRVRVHDQFLLGELIDDAGEVVASVTAENYLSASSNAAAFKGGVGAIHFSGSVTADWIQAYHLYPRRLKLLIVGDSNLAATVASGIGKSWGMRLADLRPEKDIAVSAVGSDSDEWLSRLALDLDLFQPEMVLFGLGSNYSDLTTWRMDTKARIAAAVAAGAEPLLTTQIPHGSKQSLMDGINADILSGYFGDLRVVDIATAITDDGDRVTWHWPGTDNGDHIHMSLAGQRAAFEYVRDNYLWLWLDSPNAFLQG